MTKPCHFTQSIFRNPVNPVYLVLPVFLPLSLGGVDRPLRRG
jgi:hypothetical protein